MNWYYAAAGDRQGPFVEDEFQRLVQQGVITPQTLVWREGMANWQPYGASTPPPISDGTPVDTVTCSRCRGVFPRDSVVLLANRLYCAACKPLAVQELREGVVSTSAADDVRKQYLKHEASVKSIGLLYYLGGVALFIIGLGGLVGSSAFGGFEMIPAFLLIGLGIGQFWVGTGLRRLKTWARIPTGILSGIGLLGFPMGTLINGYILYLVFSQKGKTVFSDEYREVIEQTPHIKYRTSIIVWILLALVLGLIALGLLAVVFR